MNISICIMQTVQFWQKRVDTNGYCCRHCIRLGLRQCKLWYSCFQCLWFLHVLILCRWLQSSLPLIIPFLLLRWSWKIWLNSKYSSYLAFVPVPCVTLGCEWCLVKLKRSQTFLLVLGNWLCRNLCTYNGLMMEVY